MIPLVSATVEITQFSLKKDSRGFANNRFSSYVYNSSSLQAMGYCLQMCGVFLHVGCSPSPRNYCLKTVVQLTKKFPYQTYPAGHRV
jgi:hypothetical protein